jgi:hypothetical protein
MSYWKKPSAKNYQSLDKFDGLSKDSVNINEFYEFEPAIVLDVILDETHKIFQSKNLTKVDYDQLASDVTGHKSLPTDIDYSWIGRVLVRPVYTQNKVEKEQLIWAYPLESNISEYPLINEVVIVVKYLDKVYYTRKLNQFNHVHSNERFGFEQLFGGFIQNGIQKGNRELNEPNVEFKGPQSKSRHQGGYGFEGVVGRYFWVNRNIRSLKRHEGDTIIESRFGQSIRFGAYDEVRKNDVGLKEYKDYHGPSIGAPKNPYTGLPAGGGNPFVLIRNRQRPLLKPGEKKSIYDKIPPLVGTTQEKNSGGYLLEDINYDGSSIHITCGLTISQFKTTCFKTMFQVGAEEQPAYSPFGSTPFVFPSQLSGDQIVMNSDRLIFQSRAAETFHFSKKRYAVVTDNEYTVDAHQQVVITSNTKTVLNSPAIYLGQYDQTAEPVLLGQTSVEWLYNLCNWLLAHTHWYKHGHTKKSAGRAVPDKTQKPVEDAKLIALRDSLKALLSRRVFVVGGGYAPGYDV